MFGDLTVRAEVGFIPDPRKLLAEIDALFLTLNRTPEVSTAMLRTRNLVVQSIRREYVETKVDAEYLGRGEPEIMDFVNDKLRTAMGDRLVRVVGPVVTQTREEL